MNTRSKSGLLAKIIGWETIVDPFHSYAVFSIFSSIPAQLLVYTPGLMVPWGLWTVMKAHGYSLSDDHLFSRNDVFINMIPVRLSNVVAKNILRKMRTNKKKILTSMNEFSAPHYIQESFRKKECPKFSDTFPLSRIPKLFKSVLEK